MLSYLSPELVSRSARGDFSWLGVKKGLQGGITYQRSWQEGLYAPGIACVLVKLVGDVTHAALFRNARMLRQTRGVKIAPFLAPEVRALRDQRMNQYIALQCAGLKPKWDGVTANLSILNGRGARVLYQF